MAKEKKTFMFLLSRNDSPQKLISFDLDTIVDVLKNELENEADETLLELSYEISFKEMSEKELDDIDEDGFDGF